ncbi:MAG: PQQ-binding-like beta-propeller repeat protein, partial [Acidobacteria bacterium]|nr:PQQ-binding-like beta-propeller repeat protein [Acidobacteriota bacterium]
MFRTFFILLLALAASVPAFAADPPILGAEWTYDSREGIVGQPVPFPDANSARAVLITLGSGKVRMIDSAGRMVREFQLDEAASAAALAGDLSANGRIQIVALDTWGSIYCFAEDGTRLWKYARESNEGSYRQPVLADVDGDKTLEILVTDSRGRLLVLDAAGRLKLELHVTDYRLSPPAVADLDGDGAAEIIFGTEDKEVYCFDARGELRWMATADGRFGRTLPLIADLDNDGRYEVYLSSAFVHAHPGVFALDARDGRLLWKAEAKLQSYHSLAAVDLDGDRRPELLFGDKSTSLFAVRQGGGALWSVQLGGRGIFFAPAAARLDAAGAVAILTVVRGAGPEGHSLYALDAAGKVLQGVPLPGGGTASPALVRFSAQGELKLLAVGGAGKLVCFRLRQDPQKAQILWAGLRNDANLSGYLPGANGQPAGQPLPALAPLPAPEARFAWHGTNSLGLKQVPKVGTAAVRLVRPDKSIQTTVLRFGPGLAPPQMRYEAAFSGNYSLEVRWTGSGQLPPPEHYSVNVPADGWKDADR